MQLLQNQAPGSSQRVHFVFWTSVFGIPVFPCSTHFSGPSVELAYHIAITISAANCGPVLCSFCWLRTRGAPPHYQATPKLLRAALLGLLESYSGSP